jgi:UTP--glucose-1-phosphate uridylyltransferase
MRAYAGDSENPKMKAVIPAAGLGTRFLPATKEQPKEMLPIVDKPVIQFVVEEAVASGIDGIIIVTGRGKRAIEDHFDKSFELEHILEEKGNEKLLKKVRDVSDLADIHYVRQKERKGLGDAINCARKYIKDEAFAVLLGDTIVESKVPCTKQLMDLYAKYKTSIIAVDEIPEEKLSTQGIIKGRKVDDLTYLIEDLVEKPKPEEAPSNLGIIGRYILTPEIFDALKKTEEGVGNEIQLTDAMRLLLQNQKMYALKFKGKRYDIGNVFDYMKAKFEFAIKRGDIGEDLKAHMREILSHEK